MGTRAFGMGGLGFLLGLALGALVMSGIIGRPVETAGERAAALERYRIALLGASAMRADGLASDGERAAALQAVSDAHAGVVLAGAGDTGRRNLAAMGGAVLLLGGLVWVGVDVARWRRG